MARRAGHERFPLEAHLTEDGSLAVSGDLRSPDGAISATFNGTRSGNRINYRSEFVYPSKSCKGTLAGSLDVANGGKLLIGEMVIEHNCGSDSPKPATLSLRRAR